MADKFTGAQRSAIMSRVRSCSNRATELALVKLLRRRKIKGWRRHQRLFGKPDFIFPKAKLAIFVDGCFWHSCPNHATQPVTNRAFWRRKLTRNKLRDRLVNRTLRADGWFVLRISQHELKRRNEARIVRRIQRAFLLTGFHS